MWRKDLTAIVVAGLSLVTDVRAQAHTPAADGVRSDWQQVHALKTNTTVRIDLQDGSVVKGQMKTVTDNQVVVMASRLVIIDRPEIRRITTSLTKGGSYAKRGALIGLGWGAVIAATGWPQVGQVLVSNTGLGALIGFLVGQGHGSEKVIYETSSACQITRPAGTPSDPLLLPVGRGAMRP
jgi:hypothetical protein